MAAILSLKPSGCFDANSFMISGVRKAYNRKTSASQSQQNSLCVCVVWIRIRLDLKLVVRNPESGSGMTILDPDQVLGNEILTPLSIVLGKYILEVWMWSQCICVQSLQTKALTFLSVAYDVRVLVPYGTN
jgi:hypothetical protein